MRPCAVLLAAAVLCAAADEWQARYERGLELLKAGRALEAQQEFQAVLAQAPSVRDPVALFNLGTVALESGDARSAVSYLEKASAAQPRDPVTLKSLIGAYLSAGQPAAALQKADQLLALGEPDPKFLIETGEMLSRAGHLSHAVLFYRAAGKEQTGASGFYANLLAEADAQIQRDREAVAQLQKLVAAEPRNPAHTFRLGLEWIKLGQFERAYDLFRPAVTGHKSPEIRPPEIQLGYALACYFTGRNEEAEKSYLELVRLSPGSDQPYFALGNFYADTGRTAEAVRAFRRASARNPSNYLNAYMCGVSLFRAQSYAQAETSLRTALKLNPQHADSYFWLGKIRLLEGDREKALEAFERAAKLEPKHPGAHYQRALLYAQMGEKQKSEEAFEIQRQLNAQLHKGLVALRMP